jgi:hypothetical protein
VNSTLDIHRLLDEAFAGIAATPEVQDLKEEMRANLVARVAELGTEGVAPTEAARRAIAELGDVRALVEETGRAAGPGAPPWRSRRVRPRPAFVLRTVLLALVGAAGLAVVALLAAGILEPGARPVLDYVAALGVAAVAGAVIVGDALRQETTTNYPVARPRALGYAAATGLGIAGLGSGAGYLQERDVPWLVVGAVLALLSTVGLTYLGTTQTNRHKPWVVREMRRHEEASNRFEQDPAAAARFGIYTVVIWIVATTAFVVLGVAVSWAWSWLSLLGGVVAMMLTLARMLFGEHGGR